jgi:hypothetical protein
VAAVTTEPDKQLAWEARHRTRAAIAALLSAAGLLGYYVASQFVGADTPTASGLEALQRVQEPGSVGDMPSLRLPAFEFMRDHAGQLILVGFSGLIGFVGLAWAVGFLGVATRAREPMLRKWALYLPIIGGVVVGVASLLFQIGGTLLANSVLDGPGTVAAVQAADQTLLGIARVLFPIGTFMLAIGILLVSLNAMRSGLLTRLLGYIGIVAGAMLVLFPLPVVQIYWIAALGFLFLGRWPGGDPPAWKTGRAEPWPTPQRGVPDPDKPPAAPPSERRKRKKRR